MYYKQLIASILIIFLCLTGCTAPSGVQVGRSTVHEHSARRDFEGVGEHIKIFPSVREVSRYLSQDILSKLNAHDKTVVFGFFTTLDKKNRSLLCEQLEQFLRNQLDYSQTIDYETYLKLKEYWGAIGSYGLATDDSIKMYLNTAQILITGTLILEKNQKLIHVLINANDSLSGEKYFSSQAALDYSNPDIRDAWHSMSSQPDNTIHGNRQMPVYKNKNRQVPIYKNLQIAKGPSQHLSYNDEELIGYGTGYGENEAMAYIAAKTLCSAYFVEQHVAARLSQIVEVEGATAKNHILKKNFEGRVPPGIQYEFQHNLKNPIKRKENGTYEATVEGKLKQSKLDEWIQIRAVAAGLKLKK